MGNLLHVGLDVGSTTVKIVVLDSKLNIIYENYERHFSDTKNTVCNVLEKLNKDYPNSQFTISLTGSGAMSAANFLNLPFLQEVVSCKKAVEKYIPQTDVVIELGGEDAKIIYFDKFIEQRMNGTCAGGTGAGHGEHPGQRAGHPGPDPRYWREVVLRPGIAEAQGTQKFWKYPGSS